MGRGQNKLHHMQRIIRGSTSLLRSGRIHQQEGGAGAGARAGAGAGAGARAGGIEE